MQPDRARWERLRAAFHGALACGCADRSGYIERACAGDGLLLDDVRVLVNAHEHAGAFLESPLVATALTVSGRGDDSAGRASGTETVSREGALISHYQLGPRLGAGGMGVVYQARDLALGRDAALKILPQSFAPTLLERLRAEADACARLQHPAIATFYESGEWKGTAFIAMELVPGRTLRDRLRDGPLPLDDALAVVGCLLEALSHAHAAGILHRDIKPENVILTGERAAKLLDFGLAQSLVLAEADESTRVELTEQSVAGTIGYMSPEQIRNEPLDERSDLFQVGAVLYELLTGQPAFPGKTVAERLAAVLLRRPAPLEGTSSPTAVNALLERALARDPDDRHRSAAEMLSDLMRVGAGEWSTDLPGTLAVLDFRNLGGTDDDWIGTAVGESVGVALGRTAGITLAPREKVQRARAAAVEEGVEAVATEVGLAIGCRFVLSGSYQRDGPQLRLNMELVEVSTGRSLASRRFEGGLEQIFDLQDRIVAAARKSLAVEAEAFRPQPSRPALSAYEVYARGRREAVKYERGAFDRARDFYEKAVAIDPRYPQALAGLAHAHAMRFTYTSDRAALEAARTFAQRAIEADSMLAEPYIWLGYALRRLGFDEEAEAALERTRELDPAEVYGYYFVPVTARWLRNPARSVGMLQRAVEVDPLRGFGWWGLGSVHYVLGHYSEAISCFERCARLYSLPNGLPVPGIEGYWAEPLRRTGRLEEARAKCLAGLASVERTDFMYRDTTRIFCLSALGRTAADQGDVAGSRAAFEQAMVQIKGRPRTVAGGKLLVRSLAGFARLTSDGEAYAEACERQARRDEFDFSWVWMCDDCDTYLDLANAASALGRDDEAREFRERARDTSVL